MYSKSALTQSKRSLQQGHAGILFALMIPCIMSIFIWGIEGGRAIQTKARLNDAVEVATYAVSAHNSDDEQVNKDLVERYLRAYIPDFNSLNVNITKLSCENNTACTNSLAHDINAKRFFEYRVSAEINQSAWFVNSGFSDLGDNYNLADSNSARKYQSQAVDVIFAADFSGSMDDDLKSTCPNSHCSRHHHYGQQKYKMVLEIIKEITVELEKFNSNLITTHKNKVGFVAYDDYVQQLAHSHNPQRYYYAHTSHHNAESHEDHDQHHHNYSCFQDFQRTSYSETIDNIFNIAYWGSDSAKNYRCIYTKTTSVKFHNVAVTSDFSTFNNEIKNFTAGNRTASYVGLIKAAQMADSSNANEPRRLIILLSDGNDSKPEKTKALTSPNNGHIGLCAKIRDHFNNPANTASHWTTDGKEVKMRLAIIGFDYPSNTNPSLRDCVGTDNVFKAEKKAEIKDRILELISEEIGHLN